MFRIVQRNIPLDDLAVISHYFKRNATTLSPAWVPSEP